MAIEELFGDDPNASTPVNGNGKNGGPKPAAKAKPKAAVATSEPPTALTDPFAEEAPAPNADFEALTAESSSEPSGAAPLMAAPTSPAATTTPHLPERIADAVNGVAPAPDMFAGEGLIFERRYTKVGEDVYSTTEWDHRTAAITGEGGNVVFEQKDCEIPKAWSMLATNVVVSKYFRGKVGTPQREHSVKQLISRVADTIYQWGKKDNYFATEADADAFHDELKYLLLHQYMAFNSPVWFNLGVPGEKAQVSACQPYHALVSTPQGLIPIGKLVQENAVGTTVYDAHGTTRIVATKANGSKNVLRLHTKAGYTLDVTADHLVWKKTGYSKKSGESCGKFVEAGTLREEDRLVWKRTPLSGKSLEGSREEAEAALAGWLQSDGFVGQYESGTNRSMTIEAMIVNSEEEEWVRASLAHVFGTKHSHTREVVTQNKNLDCRRIRLYGEELRPFVEKWNLRTRGMAMELPTTLYTAPYAVAAAYLRSVFQAEGYVALRENAKIGLDMISEGIVRGIQKLLLRFGIYSRVRFKADSRNDRKGCWSLLIMTLGDRKRFAQEIGFIGAAKQEKLLASLSRLGLEEGRTKTLEIERIENLGEMDVYDIQTESGEYLSGNIRVHNCFINSVDDTMESILTLAKTEGMLFKWGSGTGTNLSVLRSSKETLKGGGTASGPVSFMRGFDSFAAAIKSGGKCFKAGTLVATPEGWLPIETLSVGDLVLTHQGPRPVADFMPNGFKQCYKVKTAEGYEIEVTQGHKFAFWNVLAGRYDVKPIEWFEIGESLYVLTDAAVGGQAIPLTVPESNDPPHATTTTEMTFPAELNDELGYVVGLMYGDAELRTTNPYRVRVAFCKDEAGNASLSRFRSYCRNLFGEEPLLLGDEKNHQQVGFTRKRMVEFLVANNLAKGKGKNLGFPKALFQARAEVRAAFIAGMIDADGTYQQRGGWSVTNIDRDFLVNFQRLLLTLGVPSKLRLSRAAQNSWQNLYRLSIVGHTFIQRLVSHIAPYSAKAEHHYVPSGGADKGWGYRPSLLPSLVSRVERRGGYQIIERRVGMNATTGYGALATLAATHPHAAVADYAGDLAHCVQVTLESIAPTDKAETYDIEVEDVHLLCANGFYASNTRRAAKMVILNADHPDIEEFIECKADAEKKAHSLIEAGYSGAFNVPNGAYDSVFFQNANHSVRATDDFMRAVELDRDWTTANVLDGSPAETMRARDLMHKIAQATWFCGDPGMQFDTAANRWHTCSNTARINASNPCVTGDTLVATGSGWQRIESLVGGFAQIYGADGQPHFVDRIFPTGTKQVFRLQTKAGFELSLTADHKVLTTNRGDVPASQLVAGDRIALQGAGFGRRALGERLALAIGVAVGDGCLARTRIDANPQEIITLVMSEDESAILEKIAQEVNEQKFALKAAGSIGRNDGVSVRYGAQPGATRVSFSSQSVVNLFKEFSVLWEGSDRKRFTPAIYELDKVSLAGVLRGLFTADGTVANYGDKSQYIALDSTSLELLQQTQLLLLSFGIKAKIYRERRNGMTEALLPDGRGGSRMFAVKEMHSLRISRSSRFIFEREIGFDALSAKAKALAELNRAFGAYKDTLSDTVESIIPLGEEPVYDLTEQVTSHFSANGLVVHNCSEFFFLDDTACNLASLNLMRFRTPDHEFNVEEFKHAVRITITAQEIMVGNAAYPTDKITVNSFDYRPLGLGYANLGALLMARGLAYDSDQGRAYAAAITAILSGEAYHQSAKMAGRVGAFAGYERNKQPMQRVMQMHRDHVEAIQRDLVPNEMISEARSVWDKAIEAGKDTGYRNSQISVLAPTGTIGFLLDCDTTGVEPDIAIVKYKSLVGGGMFKIVNQTVPEALERLGYSASERKAILDYIEVNDTIEGAPGLADEHLAVFDCAFRAKNGTRTIHYLGHIKMMSAVQPFISGAISKTVNMPHDATPEEIAEAYLQAWKLGIKALAIYRDGSKKTQPLSTGKASDAEKKDVATAAAPAEARPLRRKLPDERQSLTHKFSVGGHEGYITIGLYPDQTPGEIFITMSKEGSVVSGLMDSFATSISLALQYGVPLRTLVEKFMHTRFEPSGFTGNPDIPMAKSIMDYLFRYVALKFLDKDERAHVGLIADQQDEYDNEGTSAPASAPPAARAGQAGPSGTPSAGGETRATAAERQVFVTQADAPPCPECGSITSRNGACYRCNNCGTSIGCS